MKQIMDNLNQRVKRWEVIDEHMDDACVLRGNDRMATEGDQIFYWGK